MAKVTSKLQVTLPKAVADRYHIVPGDEIEFQPAGEIIRVLPVGRRPALDTEARLRIFDAMTARQEERQRRRPRRAAAGDRGWTREDLYEGRGRAR